MWGEWSDWDQCTQTCGGGRQHRKRSCLQRRGCEGSDHEEKVCNTEHCGISEFSNLRACTCESGFSCSSNQE